MRINSFKGAVFNKNGLAGGAGIMKERQQFGSFG